MQAAVNLLALHLKFKLAHGKGSGYLLQLPRMKAGGGKGYLHLIHRVATAWDWRGGCSQRLEIASMIMPAAQHSLFHGTIYRTVRWDNAVLYSFQCIAGEAA